MSSIRSPKVLDCLNYKNAQRLPLIPDTLVSDDEVQAARDLQHDGLMERGEALSWLYEVALHRSLKYSEKQCQYFLFAGLLSSWLSGLALGCYTLSHAPQHAPAALALGSVGVFALSLAPLCAVLGAAKLRAQDMHQDIEELFDRCDASPSPWDELAAAEQEQSFSLNIETQDKVSQQQPATVAVPS